MKVKETYKRDGMNEYVLSEGYGEKLGGGNKAACSILKLVHEGKFCY